MATIKLYGNDTCPYCGAARMLLKKKRVEFDDILVNEDAEGLAEMRARTERTSVPQIFIGDIHVGGFDDLSELDQRGELDKLIAEHASVPGYDNTGKQHG
jgi:glutaredoxin 3